MSRRDDLEDLGRLLSPLSDPGEGPDDHAGDSSTASATRIE